MPNVLTIGNSFTENATRFWDTLTASDGERGWTLGKANIGGCSLEKHWNLVEQCDLIRGVKPYAFRVTGLAPFEATLKEALAFRKWDYVTLQQVSRLSWREDTYRPYIGTLIELIRSLAPNAQPVIHQTWAYRCDAPSFEEFGIGQAEMHQRLERAYANVAAEYSCPVLPCGLAFQKARMALGFVPDSGFDYVQPPLLALPNQNASLIVGHFWRTGNTASGHAELHFDEKHANIKGCYLAGAVWFEMFTGKDIASNPFCPEGVSEDELRILKNAAHDAVAEYGGPLKR